MVEITEGKIKSLKAVSDANGIIRAAAMDQRGSLRKSIAKAKGVTENGVSREEMQDFKTEVSKALTPHATAILLDPEYGLPAAKARAKNSGLLLAYEVTGYEQNVPGRMPELIPGYSVKKLKEDGGDCVKLLLYYTPFEDPKINAKKQEFVKRIGDECTQEDIAFFLEFVGYEVSGSGEKDLAYAKKKPEIVTRSIQEFTKNTYGVDVLKIEIPVNLKYTEGAKAYNGKEKAYTLEEAKRHYREAAAAAAQPFIYLSAGVSNAEFLENIRVAIDAKVDFAGVLCGRATWQEGIPIFAKGGRQALAEWLAIEGARNIRALNEVLVTGARPWWSKYGGLEKIKARKATALS